MQKLSGNRSGKWGFGKVEEGRYGERGVDDAGGDGSEPLLLPPWPQFSYQHTIVLRIIYYLLI